MAQRRMFSQRIIGSGRFLKMSASAQNLYFHLGMRADDDGVVEALPIINTLGVAHDDFSSLIDKNFIRPLNDDLVIVITDWREHNLIRADRKIDSIYKELLEEKLPDFPILEAKVRADIAKKEVSGRPVDNQMSAQVRLGKDRLYMFSDENQTLEETKAEARFYLNYKFPIVEGVTEVTEATDDSTVYYLEYENGGRKLKQSEIKELESKYKNRNKTKSQPPAHLSEAQQLISAYKEKCLQETGVTPICGKREEMILGQAIKKYSLDSIGKVGMWFLKNPKITKEEKINIHNITYTKFLNKYQLETGNKL